MINRNRKGLHVVKPPHANPVEEEKATAGINVKQLMLIGAITALTGTIVGAVGSEIYRYFRSKVPIPVPGQPPQPGQVAQNPVMPWMQPMQLPAAPPPYMPASAPMQQYAVHQIGAFPMQNPYAPAAALALPPAQAPADPAPFVRDAEPLTRPELAQWQRRLESWQRELERRESVDRPPSY